MPDLVLADLGRNKIQVRGPVTYVKYPEAAAQAFKADDLLITDSASRILIAAAAGADITSSGGVILGQAMEDASGTTDNEITVKVFQTDTEIALPVFNTAATAVTADTEVGNVYVMTNETTGSWVWSIDTTSNPVAQLLEIAESYDGIVMATGDVLGPMWGRFIRAELAKHSDVVWS